MYCPSCGAQMPQGAFACPGCGWREATTSIENDPAMRMLLPVGRSGLAIAAGYLGLFSLIVFPAPLALIVGILALRDIKRHPEKGGKGRAIFGVVMGGIFTLLVLGLILSAVVAS